MYGYFAFLKFVYEPLKFCFDSPTVYLKPCLHCKGIWIWSSTDWQWVTFLDIWRINISVKN